MSSLKEKAGLFVLGEDISEEALTKTIRENEEHERLAIREAIILASYHFCGIQEMPIQMVLRRDPIGDCGSALVIAFRNLVDPSVSHFKIKAEALTTGKVAPGYPFEILENLAVRTGESEEAFQLLPNGVAFEHAGLFW